MNLNKNQLIDQGKNQTINNIQNKNLVISKENKSKDENKDLSFGNKNNNLIF